MPFGNPGAGAPATVGVGSGIGAAVSAGSDIISSVLNGIFQGSANRKEKEWQEKMYGIQRADALADWNAQNLYNSPAQQMQRFKDAGLNPNLVYGNGSAAAGTAGEPRASSPGSYHPKAIQVPQGIGAGAIDTYLDTQVKQAQIENLHTNNEVMQADIKNKDASTVSTLHGIPLKDVDVDSKRLGLRLGTTLFDTNVEQAKENLRKTRTSVDISLDANQRAAVMNIANIAQAAQRLLLMKSQTAATDAHRSEIMQRIENLKVSQFATELDNQLRSQGINPHDPTWMRVLGRIVNGDTLREMGDLIRDNPRKAAAAVTMPYLLDSSGR